MKSDKTQCLPCFWPPGLAEVQECTNVFQVTILTEKSYISKVIMHHLLHDVSDIRSDALCVCPGPGPPGLAGVRECAQVFQVTTTTL